MEIQFYKSARTVTGSVHLIKVNSKSILLDCGLFQGRKAEAYERNKTFPFDATEIDALVLSHAHTDHAGNLLNLVGNGYFAPIHGISATEGSVQRVLIEIGP